MYRVINSLVILMFLLNYQLMSQPTNKNSASVNSLELQNKLFQSEQFILTGEKEKRIFNRIIKRKHVTKIKNINILKSLLDKDQFEISLFEDKGITCSKITKKKRNSGFFWKGILKKGNQSGTIFVGVKNNIITGTITFGEKTFQIVSLNKNKHVLIKTDQAKLPICKSGELL